MKKENYSKKDEFYNWLSINKRYEELGNFRNEYGELFVIYYYVRRPHYLYITGDEFGWSTKNNLWLQGREVGKDFLLSIDETILALIQLKASMQNWMDFERWYENHKKRLKLNVESLKV